MPLTDTTSKNARCPQGCNFKRISDAGGLYLEATRTGAKLCRLKYCHIGKQKPPGERRLSAIDVADIFWSSHGEGAPMDCYREEPILPRNTLCRWNSRYCSCLACNP